MRLFSISIIFFVLISAAFAGESDQHTYKPSNGYVPDQETAIKIALAVWEPIYGYTQISNEKPYHAELINGVWLVTGSLPAGMVGGVAEAEISKNDGR